MITMKIYIASHDKTEALKVAAELREHGHTITSRWLKQEFNPTETYTEEDRRRIACQDVRDIHESQILILISGKDKYSGGKFVEAGFALADHLEVIVLGHRENMMLWHPNIPAFDSISEIINYLR